MRGIRLEDEVRVEVNGQWSSVRPVHLMPYVCAWLQQRDGDNAVMKK